MMLQYCIFSSYFTYPHANSDQLQSNIKKVAFCISFVDSGPYQLVHASLTVRQRFDCCNQRKRITLLWPTSSAERRISYWEWELIVTKIHRSQNGVSHLLANTARYESVSDFWLEEDCYLISHLSMWGHFLWVIHSPFPQKKRKKRKKKAHAATSWTEVLLALKPWPGCSREKEANFSKQHVMSGFPVVSNLKR